METFLTTSRGVCKFILLLSSSFAAAFVSGIVLSFAQVQPIIGLGVAGLVWIGVPLACWRVSGTAKILGIALVLCTLSSALLFALILSDAGALGVALKASKTSLIEHDFWLYFGVAEAVFLGTIGTLWRAGSAP
jgi:hypothetical protein